MNVERKLRIEMGIEEWATWYQKKIGTYDKQQWEKTVEQKILHGLTHVRTKLAKPKTEFIDLDLIRGSTFPKAKPKQGLCVVTRLAIQRCFFFPFYGRWWIKQTSANIFKLLFTLYAFQFINVIIYFCHWNDVPKKSSQNQWAASPETEITLPILMMLILSLIHSLIVSTNPGPEKQAQNSRTKRLKRRRLFLASNGKEFKRTLIEENVTKSKIDIGLLKKKKIHSNYRKMKLSSINPGNNKKILDEGFESFNGNGSSENGDETKENIEMKIPDLKISSEKNENKKEDKMSSDDFESDTESDHDVIIRKRNIHCINLSKTDTETDSDTQMTYKSITSMPSRRSSNTMKQCEESSCFESDVNESEERKNDSQVPLINENLISSSEWIGVTTNSEECSYSSESINSDSQAELNNNDQTIWDNDFGPTTILSPSCAPSDLVSCTIWESNDMKKADLSVLDISSAIIGRVESIPDTLDYFYFGIIFSLFISIFPCILRLCSYAEQIIVAGDEQLSVIDKSFLIFGKLSSSVLLFINIIFGSHVWEHVIILLGLIQRFILSMLFFFQLAVAERTFKQRFLYAKLFSHLTSSRKARKSDLPHFRLNKVRNIKTWLSVRSYLKKRGPQRSIDVIVSAAFIINLLLLSFISIELVKTSAEVHSSYVLEAMLWGLCLGIYLLRFMTLGTKINSKYRNLSVLITEQINLYLQIEQKPHKKDELMVANSVLKLATDLLKELESPFKISGLSASPYLYTIMKLVILSALSGVFSEMLGFKLKLHKLNIK